jgi:hypothetical protein
MEYIVIIYFFTLKPAKRPYHKKKKIKIEGGDPSATITSGGLPSASTAATPSAPLLLAKVENKSKFEQKVICRRLVLIEKKLILDSSSGQEAQKRHGDSQAEAKQNPQAP